MAVAEGQVLDAEIAELLRDCTVRVDVLGEHGTGFFAAPGIVVTCAHVLEVLDGHAAPSEVEVSTRHGVTYAVADIPQLSPADGGYDLAVLSVEDAGKHPCALLIPGLNNGDWVHTFGYPENDPNGQPTELRAAGKSGDDRWHKLSGEQVVPGMSGSPVVNGRTGGVSGILALTRDSTQALGGYAIPVELLFIVNETLQAQNLQFHAGLDTPWFELLSPELKAALGGGQPTDSAEDLRATFVVDVRQTGTGRRRGWEIRADVMPPAGPSIKPAKVNLAAAGENVARLFRDWASRGGASPGEIRRGRLGDEEVQLLGRVLSSAVLPARVGSSFEALAAGGDAWIELALHFDDAIDMNLAYLPWEHLYIPPRGQRKGFHPATAERMALVRSRSTETRVHRPEKPRTVAALIVAVDLDPRSGERPAQRLADDAGRLAFDRFSIEPLVASTEEELDHAVNRRRYEVFHYVGWGQFRDRDELMVYDFGIPTPRGVDSFLDCLGRRMPSVVVLQLCAPPLDGAPADLSFFARDLLDAGVQAVVAYQFPIVEHHLNAAFNATFYEELAKGRPVEVAAQRARIKLGKAGENSGAKRAFLSPATFVRQPGAFSLTAERRDVAIVPHGNPQQGRGG